MHDPSRVKNLCVLAHVDHGKTTLCDYLISSSGVIAPGLAGELRFMDSRPDEQEKKITVKTSVISLAHEGSIFNVVDSPGHFDFTSEVSVALRLAEAAFVVIDVVDGVTSQTEYLIRNAFAEEIRMCVVFSKIDLLLTVLYMTPREIEERFAEILARCNAIMADLLLADQCPGESTDEAHFAPEHGNVLFTSAKWGIGFSIDDMAEMYHRKHGWKVETARRTLWGPFVFDGAKQRILKRKASNIDCPTMFEEFVAQPLHDFVHAFSDKTASSEALERLFLGKRDDLIGASIESAMKAWSPLNAALMRTIQRVFPSAADAPHAKICNTAPLETNDLTSVATDEDDMRSVLAACSQESPLTIAFIAKVASTSLAHRPYVGVCKVYSGALKLGQSLYIETGDGQTLMGSVDYLGLFQGFEIISVQRAGAGNICAVGGDFISDVIKFGTLSSQALPRPLRPMRIFYPSVFRTAVRPKDLRDLHALRQALRTLNALDLQLEVTVDDDGEFVLGTAGVVHTERCITDLRAMAAVEVEASEPIIRMHEAIHNISLKHTALAPKSHAFAYDFRAFGVPQEMRDALDHNECARPTEWKKFAREVLAGIDMAQFAIIEGKRSNFLLLPVQTCEESKPEWVDHIVSAFNTTMKAGPLAKFPVTGVCLIVRDIVRRESGCSIFEEGKLGDEDCQALLRELPGAIRHAMQRNVGVLTEPCYACEVSVKSNGPIGKIYGLINERRGKIIAEDQTQHTVVALSRFTLFAKIPVSESQRVIDAIHHASGGQASCQFFSSGWEDVADYSVDDAADEAERGSPAEGAQDVVLGGVERPWFLGNTSWALIKRIKQAQGLTPCFQLPKDGEKQKFANKAA